MGHVGKDPEIRHTKDGKKVASFSVATSERWKDKAGNKQDKTEWHNVVVFNQGLCTLVEKYVKKGSKVYLEGSLQTRKWTDNKGIERYSTEVVLQVFGGDIVLLDNYGDDRKTQPKSDSGWDISPEQSQDFDDSIPF